MESSDCRHPWLGSYTRWRQATLPWVENKSEDVFGEEDYWVIKLDTTGQIEWDNIGGVGEDEQFSIIQTQDGGYFLGGFQPSLFPAIKQKMPLAFRILDGANILPMVR